MVGLVFARCFRTLYKWENTKKIGFGQAMSDFSHYTVAKNRKVIVRFLPLVRPLFH